MAEFNPFNPTPDNSDLEAAAPDYLRAANLHNLGSSNTSWFSDVGESISHAPEFFTVAALSGLNSFYNTGVQIGNLFGAQNEENDTASWIGNIDSDLGQYYTENQKSADTMGFLLTSVIPGVAGIKILNAGQKALAAARTGLVGTNLGLALGLRTPVIDSYILQAAGDIAKGQAMYSGLQSAAVKALATGVYQNVLEGVAFETAIQATMHASPVLRDQDVSDVAWNIATGGLLQGAIGGAFHAASTIGKINKTAVEIGKPIREAGSRALLQDTNQAGLEVSFLAKDYKNTSFINPESPTYQQELDALEHRKTQILQDMRLKTGELVTGNQRTLSTMVSDINEAALKDIGNTRGADEVLNKMVDTQEITSVNGTTKIETQMTKDASLNVEQDPALQVHYWGLTGERAGTVLNSKPPVVSLADTLAETGDHNLQQKVLQKVKSYDFKVADTWDATKQPLTSLIGTHEAEARYIWADKNLTKASLKEGTQVGQFDIPVLQKALKLGQLDLTIVDGAGNLVRPAFASTGEMQAWIQAQQKVVAMKLQKNALKAGSPFAVGTDIADAQDWVNTKIGRISNIKEAALEGIDTRPAQTGDFQAWESGSDAYAERLQKQGITHSSSMETDPRFMPTWAKVTKNVVEKQLPDGNVVNAMTYFTAMQKQAAESVQNVLAKNLSKYFDQLPEITKDDLGGLNPRGTGAGFLTYSNPEQGGLGSKVALVGSVTQRAAIDAKKLFQEANQGATAALARNNGAVIEWGGLHQKASRSANQWVPLSLEATYDEAGEAVPAMRGLFSTKFIKSLGEESASAEALRDFEESQGGQHFFSVEHDETWDMVQAHTGQENKYAMQGNELATSVGKQQTKQLNLFRPIPANPADYKHFVFVKDPQVTGQGHTSMIFAQTPERLKQLVDKAKEARPELDFYSKADTEDFHKAAGDYDYDRTLSENYIDSGLKNSGVYSDYFLKTDPQAVIDDFNNYHSRKIDTQTRDLIRAKYQPQFDWLEQQARYYGNFDTSKFGGNIAALEATAKNPYLSYIKTALNLSRANENPLWNSVNMAADTAVSKVVGKIQGIWDSVKGTPGTAEFQYGVDNINRTLQRYGLNTGYMDAATQLIVNEKIPQGVLSKFVGGANAILSKLVLGLDPLNGITNALGANVLRMTELTNALRQAKNGEGVFANATVDLTGQGDSVFSAGKMTANAYKAYFAGLWGRDPAEAANLALFKNLGLIKDSGTQFKDMIDNLTLTGGEASQNELTQKLVKARNSMEALSAKGETLSGNKHFEELNRFTSAWTAKKLTDPLVQSGDMTLQEQYAYMNTLVNRVEGNTIASQRPFVFQGPIGQAVGLFQSYQFNLMQQMFRYISEGSRKDAAMLLGLQGTFFGMQGLPAFQAINQHVIGTASGNSRHMDAYDATYGVAGKNIGDLLLYGLPSNLLQTNIYSRGDINPRSVTILPNSLADVPVINASMKFFGGIKEAATKINGGGNVWESFLQGVEHSSLSRPLAGLAETLQATTGNHQVMSTTNAGGIMYTNDLLSFATMSRLAGGRPIDEAVVNDAVQRIHTYQQYDHQNMLNLAGSIKASNINGQEMGPDQVSQFAKEYTQNGGRLVNFNKFMVNEIKSVHTSAAEKIVTGLKNPFAQRMQTIMGGAESPQSITDQP